MKKTELKQIIKEEVITTIFGHYESLREDILPGNLDVQPASSSAVTASVTGSTPEPEPTEPLPEPVVPTNQPEIKHINRTEAVDVVIGTRGKIFTCLFVKKTDGQERLMNCRLGVKKYLKGGTLRWDPISKGFLPVYDLQKMGYRMINFNTMKLIKVGQLTYIVQ